MPTALCCAVPLAVAAAQLGATEAPLTHVEADRLEIAVDGRLDEPIWARLPVISDFVVIEPDTLETPAYRSYVRMFHTEHGLYVGFELHQPPGTRIGRLSGRNRRDLNRDAVFITLDSSGAGRYGYWFGIALGDSLMDGTVLPERQFQSDWDGPWHAATTETDYGWSAEMFLPWSMMTMPRAGGDLREMGVYISRKVAHLDERWAYPALPETEPRFMSALAPIEMAGVEPRQHYSVFPYGSVTADGVDDELRLRAGADVFWRPSSDFQLMAALNPDFGTVETDDVIIDLTAFEVFFPEKRLFFLEGRELFIATPRAEGGGQDGPVTLLNTRRIGGRAAQPELPEGVSLPRREREQFAELLGAVKATGERGSLRYGVLAAAEDDTGFRAVGADGEPLRLSQDGSNYGVARLLYRDQSAAGARRELGWMGTIADQPHRRAVTQGVDFHYLSSEGAWRWNGQLLFSDVEDASRGAGGFVDVDYVPRRGRSHSFSLAYYDRNVDVNDLGFLRRNDVLNLRYVYMEERSDIDFARNAGVFALLDQEWNHDREAVRSGIFTQVWVERRNRSRIQLDANYFPARYDDRNSRGHGSYRIDARSQLGLHYRTDASRPLALTLNARLEGEDLGGRRYSLSARLAWHPTDRFTSNLELMRRHRDGWLVHQGGRNFTTFDAAEWNLGFDMGFFFTARQELRGSLQWVGIKARGDERFLVPERPGDLIPVAGPADGPGDDFTISSVSAQLRYRWEMAPMSELFIVYTRNADLRRPGRDGFSGLFSDAFDEPLREELVVKLRYRFGN